MHVDGRPVELDGWEVQSGIMPKGSSGEGMEGVGEGLVRHEEEVGWALIWKGDEEEPWDGEMEVVEWEELVRALEDAKPT